jgi:hypothetical protein
MTFEERFMPRQRMRAVVNLGSRVLGYWPPENVAPKFRIRATNIEGWLTPNEASTVAAELTQAVRAYEAERDA